MDGNSFGKIFRLTTFGESHGKAIGGIIDGCPAGLEFDEAFLQKEMQRRKPGQSEITTQRLESDEVEFLSGVFEGKTLGTPIGFLIRNEDQRSSDYESIKHIYRPGHADAVWDRKFGFRDYRGGGRSSARETASRVVGGAVAKILLRTYGIRIHAYVSKVKHVELKTPFQDIDFSLTEKSLVRCPDPAISEKMIAVIESARNSGDSVGGTIDCVISGVEAGLGDPVFDKLDAMLAHAMLSINATRGFEMFRGFESSGLMGSENNLVNTGIVGGISDGHPIVFRTAFKPVSTISMAQQAMTNTGEEVTLEAKGRHDPCVLPRAVPIVEAMAAMVMADMVLRMRSDRV
ncbi:MAG: chorismate synthase [Flavobacteriales bacterium]|nr:chorismate synthase [Flavobacteriales bacterium]